MKSGIMSIRLAGGALGAAGLVAATALTAGAGNAVAADDFYKGKTLKVIVGYAPGGGYDRYTRTFAAHVGKHIPGNPTTVVQNMPGASAIRSANYITNQAPNDGTEILVFSSSATFAPVFGNTAAKYKPTDFTWIGSFVQSTGTCSAWHTSGIESFKDLIEKEHIFGASGPAGLDSQYPRGMNAALGTRIKVIHGYNGTKSILLALQRGEVQGGCGYQLSSLKSAFIQYYESGKLKPVVQFGVKSDELKGVPHIMDYAKTDLDKQAFTLIFMRDVLGRPLAGPQNLPAERTATLRAAFDATMKDPEYLKMANKARLTLDPRGGAGVTEFVEQFAAVSPEAVAKARKALEIGKVEKAKLKTVAGKLTKIGKKGKVELTLDGGKVANASIHSRRSNVVINGDKAKSDDLQVGMSCSLSYLGDGDRAKTIACKN